MNKFLIVHHKPEMRDMLYKAIQADFDEEGDGSLVTEVSNQKEALDHCGMGEPFDCIVLSLDVPAARGKPARPKQGGLELLESLRALDIDTPCLVLGPAADATIEREISDLDAVPVFEDRVKALDQAVVRYARQELGKKKEAEPNRLEVEINLALKTFEIKDVLGLVRNLRGDLNLGRGNLSKRMEQLIRSVKEDEPSQAKKKLRELGSKLHFEFFKHPRNNPLRDDFVRAKQATGCREERVQLRFVVSEHEHVIPLEAIMSFDRDEHWMLQAPLYRAVNERPRADALFVDKGRRRKPLNCLLINANTVGNVDNPACQLARMHNTKKECEALKKIIERQKGKLNVGKVMLLSPEEISEKDTPCADTLKRRLQNETWHLVHYAGHSYYESQKGREGQGYLFLPEGPSLTPTPVEARDFANWFLEMPNFVYLSSCESAADDFVFELARAGLPAVAGFRWGIKEDAANSYAQSFYKHLFKERCLEVAFWRARREIHDKSAPEENLIWASAMLVVQDYR
jgi:CheY-like chemotaxis protein